MISKHGRRVGFRDREPRLTRGTHALIAAAFVTWLDRRGFGYHKTSMRETINAEAARATAQRT